eukprot:m51a1_g10239 hypothetical protein (199) ;mRNA; f:22111-22707
MRPHAVALSALLLLLQSTAALPAPCGAWDPYAGMLVSTSADYALLRSSAEFATPDAALAAPGGPHEAWRPAGTLTYGLWRPNATRGGQGSELFALSTESIDFERRVRCGAPEVAPGPWAVYEAPRVALDSAGVLRAAIRASDGALDACKAAGAEVPAHSALLLLDVAFSWDFQRLAGVAAYNTDTPGQRVYHKVKSAP